MIKRVSHVGVVVGDLDQTLKVCERIFGLKPAVVKDGMGGKVRVAFVPVGDGEIELIQPRDSEIALGKFLQTHGPGVHHISLSTDDIDSEVERMRSRGVAFAEETPKIGAHGVRIIFTKPETTGGIAFELCEET
jgi:methylmalonyl-CoA/ethylmalonyl-CoA epimerase